MVVEPAWNFWGVLGMATNILGCLIALYLLYRSARNHWDEWNLKTQSHWWSLVGWTFLGFELTIEMLTMGIKPGPRTVIQTLVIAWTIRALTIEDKLESQAPGFSRKGKKH